MLKRVVNTNRPHKETIPLLRRCIGFILLIGFINTMVFPTHSIVHYYVKSASLQCTSPSNANLVEYIVEDYLDITNPAADAQDTDVYDMEMSLEDVDFIHHNGIVLFDEPIQVEPIYNIFEDYRLFNSYLTQTTPPPEA
ncbi:hypothetical protein GXP67_11120 [Rhodocytophaga rosea]|uniref:Uncharacterized protein n=1 Tax=Rhodocytophaga rosea TaxID=2704465 RepID=A0A6C0GGZ9_9BACT|nr:hypothetical protein [Rhodocytophaga rosea]QHT67155.1 hypothetical protein GXP67_11120 [Rhodocytophaga rosea]